MSESLRIILVGAHGRMGKAIANLVANESGLTIAAKVTRDVSLAQTIDEGEVVIDFSLPAATESVCQICAAHQRPLVLGTTGHNDAQKSSIQSAAAKTAIVFSANFSVGMNVLFSLAGQTAKSLGESFDIEIVEAHHRTKKDSPSGTAKRLAGICRKESDAIHSLRAGDIVGDHTVVFAGEGERLELTHRASNREIFARGSLRAAQWVVRQKPGLYEMSDVLGLS